MIGPCVTCIFWLRRRGDNSSETDGWCRRYPPMLGSPANPVQPVTSSTTQCGEWEQKS